MVLVSYTIAFAGVAIGSMNEKDGPMAVGMEKYSGCAPTDSAMANEIGMKMEAVAELVENSVITTTTIERITCIPNRGREDIKEFRLQAISEESPDTCNGEFGMCFKLYLHKFDF
uniref:Uncharacterized protein n=1 Tax=Caenorhabditis japonica TaxID=281687 RepID=A0A8R1EAC4_CAEJA